MAQSKSLIYILKLVIFYGEVGSPEGLSRSAAPGMGWSSSFDS